MSTSTQVVQLPDPEPHVQVINAKGIHIRDLTVDSPEIADAVAATTPERRDEMVRDRLELGFRAAELARRSGDVDALKTNMERVSADVMRTVQQLPTGLAQELGGKNGRVAAPIVQAAEGAVKAIVEQLERVNRAIDGHVGPANSSLSRRLQELERLLDPTVDGSAPKQIIAAARELGTADSPLAMAMAKTVAEQIKPLRDTVDALGRQIQTDAAVKAALQPTPAKGLPFEDQVVDACVSWAHATASAVSHVGGDNQPGDVTIDPTGFEVGRIVIECRSTNDAAGRVRIARHCDAMMAARAARAAIYLTETPSGLAKEIGEWGEGETERGPWIATTRDLLTIAIRCSIVMQQLAAARSSKQQVDELAIAGQLKRIRVSLRDLKDIRTKAGTIRKTAGGIDDLADSIRANISAAIGACEELLRASPDEVPTTAV